MNYNLSKEYLMVQKMAREFAENEVKPLAQEIDEQERFPEETVSKMFKYGFLGLQCPEEWGGEGGDAMAYVLAFEEIAKVCASTSCATTTHSSVSIYGFLKFGTQKQKAKYLPQMTKGGKLCGFAITEPGAGTDASMQQTKAQLDGDYYVLNGTKMFITGAGHNEFYIICAMTDKSKGTKGLSAFIVQKDNPGLKIGRPEKKMGIRGSSACELILENCRVHKDDMLGKEGEGFKIAMVTLDSGRIGIATQAIGIAQGAIDEAIKYVKERKQFGKRISEFQNTQFTLADLQTKVDAGRLLLWRAALLKDAGEKYSMEAAMAKLYCSEIANEATRKCVQLFGGYGYTREYPVERMMRDAKITEIYEGTSEAQKMVISRNMKVF